MKKEEKELLLEDLCGRLPYGVKCQVREDEFTYIGTLCRIEVDNENGHLLDFTESMSGLDCQVYLSEVKPYLFPLSNMTEEQKEELYSKLIELELKEIHHLEVVKFEVEYYFKNHIDYMNLIPRGLAIDATGLNIY